MKIIVYSDLHLEFGKGFIPADGDVMILAGDIISFKNFTPLTNVLESFKKPILYIAGNHEYYTKRPMQQNAREFKEYLHNFPHVIFLQNEAVKIDGVNFFGGTMWTDFNNDPLAKLRALAAMNDYYWIKHKHTKNPLTPDVTVEFHEAYVRKLVKWLENTTDPRVVVSHHAPVYNPNSKHYDRELKGAYNSLDMIPIIEKYQPDLWIYGHCHEPDDQTIGKTRIISNPRGYPMGREFECAGFREDGIGVELTYCGI